MLCDVEQKVFFRDFVGTSGSNLARELNAGTLVSGNCFRGVAMVLKAGA